MASQRVKFVCYSRLVERKHIITLSGRPGSGKSSTADRISEMLGYTRYSSGETVRNLTHKRKITLSEFNKQAEVHPEMDHEIDEELRKLRDHNDIVIDSRLGFYWIPESFKVYLELSSNVAAERIFKDASNILRSEAGEKGSTVSDLMEQVDERMTSEKQRFHKLYGVDPYDTEHFDLVIDTGPHSPQTVALIIVDAYNKWLESERWKQVIIKRVSAAK